MIDFLLADKHPVSLIKKFLANVFLCEIERIAVFEMEEFNALSVDWEGINVCCICVLSPVEGDASLLLQLYRYEISISDAADRIMKVASEMKIRSYIARDSFNGWLYAGDSENPVQVSQRYSDRDDLYYFNHPSSA